MGPVSRAKVKKKKKRPPPILLGKSNLKGGEDMTNAELARGSQGKKGGRSPFDW